jgi:PAS domain S-box-containing protein
MSSHDKTREQLLAEVQALRARLAKWERAGGANHHGPESSPDRAQRLRQAVEAAQLGIWEWDARADRAEGDAHCQRLSGQAPAGTLETFLQAVHPEDREALRRATAQAVTGGGPYHARFRVVRPDGSVRWLTARGQAYRDEQGSPAGLLGVVQDITERTRAEEALRDSEARYRVLFEHNPQPMFVFDADTLRYLAVNDAAVHSYGYSRDEFLAMTVKDIRPPEDVPSLLGALARGSSYQRRDTWRHRKKFGELIDVEIDAHTILFGDRPAWVVLATDVTERKRLEEQLRQAHKMEAVGRLAGGVAHEFNNLLTVITGYSQLILDRLAQADPLRGNAEEIKKAAQRAAGLTAQLLAFGRKGIAAPRVLDLHVLVRDLEGALRGLLGGAVELAFRLAPGPGPVRIDPGQFQQVLLNLALNAREAMPQGGRLTVETADVELGADDARRHAEARPGPHILLAVADTGRGLSAVARAHLFEPFFTTKGVGEGTGLGLSTAYGIVKQAGGHIEVESEAGRGTTFRVYLPRSEVGLEPEDPPPASRAPHGAETVLLVEDEEMVRRLVRLILLQEGYAVIEAANGVQALERSEQHPGPIHLLVADVVMPQMGGEELARRLLATRPQMPVLFLSGYTGTPPTPDAFRAGEGGNFLQKPFAPRELARKVHELLDSRTGPLLG